MSKVLVTGVTGRIGANLAVALIEKGYEVRGYVMPGDPKEPKLAGLDIEIVHGDLRDAEAVDGAMEGVERVAHLGYIMGRPKGMTAATEFDINMTGTFNVLESAAKRADQIERYLFASTNATYDVFHARYVPLDEDHPQEPNSFYGMEKLLGEKMTQAYLRQHGLQTTIVRFGTVPGPDEVLRFWHARYVLGMLRGQGTRFGSDLYVAGVKEPWKPVEAVMEEGIELVVPRCGGKSWMQDLVDVRDTVDGILCALEHPNAVGEAFNTTGFGITWEQAITHLAQKTSQAYREVEIPNMWHWRCDNTKAKSLIGYMPKVGVERMIDDALAFQEGVDIGVLPT
jgi:UDP-glucose 4-epimerase